MRIGSKISLYTVTLLFLTVSLIYIFPNQLKFTLSTIKDVGSQLASVILSHNFKTVAQIKKNYELALLDPTKKVRILLVPGHNPGYGGAEFKNVKERNLTVELAEELKQFFQNDERYDVLITRNNIAWLPEFETYFKDHRNEIKEWKKASREEFSSLVNIGSVISFSPTVFHNNASSEGAVQLYGITKWSNENDIDIIVHIHFNDNPRTRPSLPGVNSGFTIYVPAEQYGNSVSTKTIANNIFKRLEKYNPVSSLPGESAGIVDELALIAIGSNNTSDAVSMLIEYSYIYEPWLQNSDVKSLIIREMAYETYLGFQDFFNPAVSSNQQNDTLVLPHLWDKNLTETTISSADVFALQTALMIERVYPPPGKSKNDCPRDGKIGPCTRSALRAFQDKYKIQEEQGRIGSETRRILSKNY